MHTFDHDESGRLRAVAALNLLDTQPEERFDRITRAAQRLLRVQIAQISLVDGDRQWIKSSCGIPPRESPRSVSFCAQAIQQKGTFIVEDALEDPRFRENPLVLGEPFIRFYAGVPLRDRDGFTVGTLCLIDRKPRRLSNEELEGFECLAIWAENQLNLSRQWDLVEKWRQSKELLETILASLPEGVICMGGDGRFSMANPAAEALFNAPPGGLVGLTPVDMVIESDRHLAEVENPDAPLQLTAKRRDGTTFPCEVTIRFLGQAQLRGVAIVRDLSLRHRLEELRRDLIAMTVHDLRSPLTGILGFAELAAADDSDLQSDLSQILSAATRMQRMLTEVLDLSRLESGQMPLSRSRQRLEELTRQALGFLAADGRVVVEGDKEATAEVDASLVVRVIENLVGNAFKHGARSVQVRIREEPGFVHLSVVDDGPGIPCEQQQRVFNRFAQAGQRTEHSSGLGLHFCKLAVEAHGGTVGLTSEPGNGAEFWFQIPK